MKKSHLLFLFVGIITLSLAQVSCMNNRQTSDEGELEPQMTREDTIKRGEYLVTIIGCNDCHSPKKMGERGPEVIPGQIMSGYQANTPLPKFDKQMIENGIIQGNMDMTAFAGPWGVSFAANLTPDQTGLGAWSEKQFKVAMRQGKFKGLEGSRMLLPPMPWYNFTALTDDDLRAIFEYLKTLEPVNNVVPPPVPPEEL